MAQTGDDSSARQDAAAWSTKRRSGDRRSPHDQQRGDPNRPRRRGAQTRPATWARIAATARCGTRPSSNPLEPRSCERIRNQFGAVRYAPLRDETARHRGRRWSAIAPSARFPRPMRENQTATQSPHRMLIQQDRSCLFPTPFKESAWLQNLDFGAAELALVPARPCRPVRRHHLLAVTDAEHRTRAKKRIRRRGALHHARSGTADRITAFGERARSLGCALGGRSRNRRPPRGRGARSLRDLRAEIDNQDLVVMQNNAVVERILRHR